MAERIIDFEAGDGAPLRLTNVRNGHNPHRGPVLLVHGAGVRSNVFRAPVETTIVDALLEHGYDVWLLDWRASISLPERSWSLDEAAVHDHPAAVRRVVAETGHEEVKAIVHCQGSTSFTMAAAAGLLPQVSTILSNAVSMHPVVSTGGRMKLATLLPLVMLLTPKLDPRWGAHPPDFVANVLAAIANLMHRDCDNRVCKMVSFTYGHGDPALWSHDMISEATHAWIEAEFGAVPLRLHRQLARCVSAGHLVSVDGLPDLPVDFTADPPRTDARFSFFAGQENHCFLPESQVQSHAWFDHHAPGRHTLHVLPRFGHLDVFMGDAAAREVFPLMIAELDRGNSSPLRSS